MIIAVLILKGRDGVWWAGIFVTPPGGGLRGQPSRHMAEPGAVRDGSFRVPEAHTTDTAVLA